MRLGAFQRQLIAWAEQPCVLTVSVRSTNGSLRFAGILRPYFSLSSMRGWALVPPLQHGGFEAIRLTELAFDEATTRIVVGDEQRRRLRYSTNRETLFTLQRDDAVLTAPPRAARDGRYLYVGGRRRQVPEPWMLQ